MCSTGTCGKGFYSAAEDHEIEWEWIKGHNGHYENERCDLLAREAIIKCRMETEDEKA